MATEKQFVLASASPRRAELLEKLSLRFTIAPQHIDETRRAGETVTSFVQRLAREKAQAGAAHGDLPVLGADTLVVIDDEPLGKPADRDHAIAMLQRLSGRRHEVMTAVAVAQGVRCEQALSISSVRFRDISPREADAYWQSGEPADKAGGYAIQGLGGVFVQHLEGSYSGVMGLPVFETAELLAGHGIKVLWDC